MESLIFDTTATVYTRAGTGGYTTQTQAGLRCRLAHLDLKPAPTGADRNSLAERRRLLWDVAYVMPDEARLLINGQTWQMVPRTPAAHDDMPTQFRAAEVVRVT